MQTRPGDTEAERDRAWRDSRGLGSRRTRTFAFGVSIAAHVVAILLYSSVMHVLRPDAVSFPVPSASDSEQGVEVLRLMDLEEISDPETPDDPTSIDQVTAQDPGADAPVLVGPGPGALTPPGPSAAERLRPDLRDGRIWARLPDEFYELSLDQQEELLAAARIVEWYDSLSIAEAAEAALTDWTIRDGQGGRWGVADGRIYLGDFSLPFPLAFGTPVGKRDEFNRRIWEFEEISRQSERFLIQQSWQERAAATRARRDRERAQARDTIGGV